MRLSIIGASEVRFLELMAASGITNASHFLNVLISFAHDNKLEAIDYARSKENNNKN